MYFSPLASCLLFARLARTQTGVIDPISEQCGPSVVCVKHYANVLPNHFYRNLSTIQVATSFGDTTVANGTVLQDIKSADFVVYDQERGLEILGSNPSYEYMFAVSDAVHEAPVYVASQNKLYLSQLAPPAGYLPQLVIDLNQDPPTLSEFLSDPPVYAPNGGTFYNGQVIWGASGGNRSIGGLEQRVGLKTLDPETNKTVTLLNNYYGYYFNNINDLSVHKETGDIWFTDPQYSWFNKLTDTPPQLPSATYRYNPSSGAVFVVEDTLSQPNGIAFNPDYSIVYIGDSGAVSGPVDPSFGQPGTSYNATGRRAIYAYDLIEDGTMAINKRPIYLSAGYVPDGLKVAANGYILTGNGRGVDVLDPRGQLLLTVQTNYTVQNFAWTGPELKTIWMMGSGGISKVEWNLEGQELK
ncbi:SMP-30/gluconolactonase/LRE family protein [Aspergillus clavatus NRRL 1]|uniref:Lactonohydrolase, putative n=1 Tax=Aspergillus clavatus (strain ATCC 1007 / CBS 513.65 / DSM 816 / NCTC 3887 / NRRL 1 / QM 1276 / 107) TaxID=344612 RepID=A1CQL0_ASPCL|nr:lactonohydrolase, putative [Aspergillus clavatus NRRL 1]EAW07931.1 lactonohydrolase, putative [Aspergillus clavatus NRRL 1]